MEVNNTSGTHSPEVLYSQQLSTQFKQNLVSINGHTPYDDDEAVTYSQSDFHTNLKFRYAQENEEDDYRFGIETNYKPNTLETGANNTEFPPKSVFTFQNSSVSSSKDPVKGTLDSKYDFNRTLVVKNAKKAYSNAAGLTKDPVGALNQKQVEFKKPKSDFV